ncbi:preprotein translocase subunit SecE [Corynebacterium sphenisci]|uniref:preprotein translocase subunit SecE n=1 Tax=Corynebacterium sphenisci TaxID=191493 RepID=UPI0026E0B314|nr:preprotein translocase subunit SecE [Corynebacterium sphenisci]MDO5730858.1 preprotein translocase subunit SecE [Corynebacterium sphenisci]
MAEHNQSPGAEAQRPAGKRQVAGVAGPAAGRPARRAEGAPATRTTPVTFVKQVLAELRKVIWPTGRQMLVYSIVVLAFLIFSLALVWGVDTLAGLGVSAVFGS